MPKQKSYLGILRFDPRLAKSFIAAYLSNPRYVLLLVIAIVGIGLYSFFNLPRTLNPEIKIPIVIVSTVLPGAGPADVELLVTVVLEDEIASVDNVKTVESSSEESVSLISIEFESGVDPEKARSDVKSAVENANLPQDAQDPTVRKLDFTRQPIWTFALSAKDTASLMRYSQQLKDRLEDLSSIDEVTTSGYEQQEIEVVLKPQAIASYNLSPFSISSAIKSAIDSLPSGVVSTGKSTFALSLNPSVASIDDIRNLKIWLGDSLVNLSEIAVIYEHPKPNQALSYIASKEVVPNTAVTFNIFKSASVNIDKAYQDAKKLIDQERAIREGKIKAYSVLTTAKEIDDQFSELTRDFLITVALVFIALFIFLGIRQAIVSSLTIPLTFFISFTVMYAMGLELSFISLFSLLLALGLLVDDTIVVVSAMTAYYRTKKFTPLQTGLLVWRDFFVPVFSTTITTVWAFLPLLLSTGIIGEFIKSIPIVASSTLLASFFVAMMITLPFVVFLLKGGIPDRVRIFLRILLLLVFVGLVIILLPKGSLFIAELFAFAALCYVFFTTRVSIGKRFSYLKKDLSRRTKNLVNFRNIFTNGVIHFSIISDRYHNLIEKILSSRRARRYTLIMTVVFTLFSYLLFPLGFVRNEFFPKTDQDFIFVSLELPSGTDLSVSSQYAKDLLDDLRKTEETLFVTAEVGQAFSSTQGIASAQGNNILFTLVLFPENERRKTSSDIGEILREKYSQFQNGKISIVESTGGPPAGSDLQIKLFGNDLALLNNYADNLQDYLRSQPGVINIDKSIKSGTSKLVFVPDKEKTAQAGISQDTVGLWLRLFASGIKASSVKFEDFNNQEKDVTIRLNSFIQNPESIWEIAIPSPNGNVFLSSVGKVKLEDNPSVITREDGKRTISVTAGVLSGHSISESNKKLEQYADSLSLPAGYSWKTGGVNEENQQSVNSILVAMILSFLLIITTMVIQFGSFRRALIVMLVIPLSISGVFVIFALTNTPLSFPSLIGLLALFGIVVKNSILIVDKIVRNEKTSMTFTQAIADASSSRLEAIALTSVATIMGLLPITLSDPIWRGLGGAIIAGLAFSGTITLFFIPVTYYYFFARQRKRRR